MAKRNELNFNSLVTAIWHVHEHLAAQAGKAVNVSLTLRSWLIGCYIREYEQNGADRAEYGANLLDALSGRLTEAGMKGMASRTLRLYRQFYLAYPQIRQTLSAKTSSGLLPDPIWQSLSAKSAQNTPMQIQGTLSPELGGVGCVSALPRRTTERGGELWGVNGSLRCTVSGCWRP